MKLPSLLFALGLALAGTVPAHAAVTTISDGASLVSSCARALQALDKGLEQLPTEQQTDAFVCMAFLSGVISTAEQANRQAKLRLAIATKGQGSQADFNLYCFDWQLPYKRVAQLLIAHARDNRQLLSRPAQQLVLEALQQAFPCR